MLSKIFKKSSQRHLKNYYKLVEEINKEALNIDNLDLTQLKVEIATIKEQIKTKEDLDQYLPKVFAIVRHCSELTLGYRHYDTQLIGAIALHKGEVAELKTGEGKTLMATLAAALNALLGLGVHVVTVNDYLVRRDAGWMGPVYHSLGLVVAIITSDGTYRYNPAYNDINHDDDRLKHFEPISKQAAYEADITYALNNELGFDYLRDNMVHDKSQRVQRELNFAIIDEVDSILIDEARTPLIISQPVSEDSTKYGFFADLSRQLKPDDYKIDEKSRSVILTEDGISKVENILNIDHLYNPDQVHNLHLLENAMKAQYLFTKDKDYIVRDSADGPEVLIVDEFTGRLLAGRRYSEGLHQAIESKEGLVVREESKTMATISFQNYFRIYKKIAGMTGTAVTEAEEFSKIYNLEVLVVPPNKPSNRTDLSDRIYKTNKAKMQAVVEKVMELHKLGQPVLIGTIAIEKNEYLSRLLTSNKIKHQVLNAKNNEREAEIIALAGQRGAVTLATNIAGRGTDIVLEDGVANLGGLFVLGTEKHESRRIDNQLRGRAGRQGDPGYTQFFVSLEDDLMRVFGGERIASMMNTLGVEESQAIENKLITRSLDSAQRKVEGHNFDSRKRVVEYDDVLNQQRQIVYAKRLAWLQSEHSDEDILEILSEKITAIIHSFSGSKGIKELFGDNFRNNIEQYINLNHDRWEQLKQQKSIDDIESFLIKFSAQDLKDNSKSYPNGVYHQALKSLSINLLDDLWLSHLEGLDSLREGIGLRGYGQKDPLVEYKIEAFRLFEDLIIAVKDQIAKFVFKIELREDKKVDSSHGNIITDQTSSKAHSDATLSRAQRRRLKLK